MPEQTAIVELAFDGMVELELASDGATSLLLITDGEVDVTTDN